MASDLGGRRVFNSGAGVEKGDAAVTQGFTARDGRIVETKTLTLRVESKTSTGPYTFSVHDWEKLADYAKPRGEIPVFHIELREPQGFPLELVVLNTALVECRDVSCGPHPTRRCKSIRLGLNVLRQYLDIPRVSPPVVVAHRFLMAGTMNRTYDLITIPYWALKGLLGEPNASP